MWVHLVQHFAVVGDDQGGRGVFLQPRLEPESAFQVEVVGRFVQQQHVGLGEQGGGEGDAHAPASRIVRHRPLLVLVVEAQARQDLGRAAGGAVGVDLDQPGPDLAHLLGLRCLEAAQQVVTLGVGLKDGFQHADRRGRVFLIDRADAGGLGQTDLIAVAGQFAQDDLEQGRLADAIAAHKPDLGAGRQAD